MNEQQTAQTTIEPYEIKAKCNGIEVRINLNELDLSDADRSALAETIGWGSLLQEAMDRLAGESGNASSEDSKLRLDFLLKVGATTLTDYRWEILRGLIQAGRNISAHKHIYWTLYHEKTYRAVGPDDRQVPMSVMLDHLGIESNYGHKSTEFDQFEQGVHDKLDEAAKSLLVNAEAETLRIQRDSLLEALQALGSMPEGYCFCRENRDPLKPEHEHTGECLAARAAIAKARGGAQ